MSGKNKNNVSIGRRSANIFCVLALAFMLAQWVLIYVGGNLNGVLLSFKHFDPATETQVYYTGADLFKNFTDFFHDLFMGDSLGKYFLNGVLFHLMTLLAMPVSLMISFVIVKKMPMTGFYKVMMFLPSVISAMVIAMIFQYVTREGFRGIWMEWLHKPYGDFKNPLVEENAALPTLLLYTFFFAMPGSLLINVGTMSRVPEELIEYGKLEGISLFQEFIHVMVPLMYPVLEVYLLGAFVGFFTATGPLYAIYGAGDTTKMILPENAKTFGYYIFVSVIADSASGVDKRFMFGYTSAINLTIGLLSIPIAYGTKKLLDIFDPDVEF